MGEGCFRDFAGRFGGLGAAREDDRGQDTDESQTRPSGLDDKGVGAAHRKSTIGNRKSSQAL
jgi:hypothetical protein